MSPSELTPYLKGERDVGLAQVDRLAEAIGVTAAELLSEGSPAPREHYDYPLEECLGRVERAAGINRPDPAALLEIVSHLIPAEKLAQFQARVERLLEERQQNPVAKTKRR